MDNSVVKMVIWSDCVESYMIYGYLFCTVLSIWSQAPHNPSFFQVPPFMEHPIWLWWSWRLHTDPPRTQQWSTVRDVRSPGAGASGGVPWRSDFLGGLRDPFFEVSWNGGTPIAGWFRIQNATKIAWFWGTPMTQETFISRRCFGCV